ncbi:hypothetical protein DH2020_006199 [Rehmannia glutinosa]|uniref:Uncharacterized protein n=1 Tax=Rehmannia glutinosa TaxID=99300 RepID=A0ABR0XIF0_REHGL
MDEDLSASKRRKIEDTVLQILKATDLDTATEFSVRAAAEQSLGLGLSDLTHRRLVQHLIRSFLLSSAAAILGTTSSHRNNDGNNNDENGEHHIKQPQQRQLTDVRLGLEANYNGKIICKLSDKRMVTIHDAYGATMVAIRDFDMKDGNMLPKRGVNTGLSLTATQWSSFRNSFPSIQEAIENMESRLGRKHAVHQLNNLNRKPEAFAKQSDADMTNSVIDSAVEKSQTEADISNLTSILHHPTKSEQTESEAEITNPATDSVAEKNHSQAVISNLTSTSDSREQIPSERNQTDAVISDLVPPFVAFNAVGPERSIPDERKQTEAGTSTWAPAFPTQEQLHHTVNTVRPKQLVPIQIARLDGRNYHSWKHQMEFFLNQLNIAYALSEQCPSLSSNPEASFDEQVKVKAAIQRWIDDDYMCRHNILNSLCDNLFNSTHQKIILLESSGKNSN